MSKPIIILFHPKTLHEKNYRYYHIPYSILSIASMIDREKYELLLIDNNLVGKNDFSDLIQSLNNEIFCVGISSMIGHQIEDGINFAKTIRTITPSAPIIWGGPLPTILPQETIENECVDIIVKGPGEITFKKLIDAISSQQYFGNILGISYKKNGKVIHNPTRNLGKIDKFPPYRFSYDLINVADYIRFDEHINTRTVSYHSSQGCPFRCGFCCEVALWGQRWSGFSSTNVLSDIEFLVSKFDINGIKFYDSEFFVDHKRAFEIITGLIERNLRIKWYASVHPNNLSRLTINQFGLLQKSGAARLLIGAESSNQSELKLIEKGTNKGTILNLAKKCSEFGIIASFTFITGYPSSPSSYIEDTLNFARELREIDPNHECKVHFYAPFPGTPLYQHALSHGFIPPRTLYDWSKYDYYYTVTPWVEKKYESVVREFNETSYPYLHASPISIENI